MVNVCEAALSVEAIIAYTNPKPAARVAGLDPEAVKDCLLQTKGIIQYNPAKNAGLFC